MDIGSEGLPSVDTYYQTTVDAVRGLATLVLREHEGDELLRLLGAVGTIATGLREFSPQIADSPLEIAANVQQLPAHVEPEPLAPAVPEVIPPFAAETHHDEPKSEEPAAELAEEVTNTLDVVRGLFPGLRISGREADMLLAIMKTAGSQFRTSDIIDGLEGTLGARKQTMIKLVHKIIESPYADQLVFTGERGARRYWWHGVSKLPADSSPLAGSSEPPLAQQSEPAPTQPDTEQGPVDPEVIDQQLLARYGFDMSVNGHKKLSHNGITLRLSETSVDVLLALARRNGRATLKDVVEDLRRVYPARKTIGDDVPRALGEIDAVLERVGIHWRNVPLNEDGKKVRKLALGDLEQNVPLGTLDTAAFLGRR